MENNKEELKEKERLIKDIMITCKANQASGKYMEMDTILINLSTMSLEALKLVGQDLHIKTT